MASTPKNRPEGDEKFGIGMKADGTVNVLTPEQYAKALLQRQADEEIEADATFMGEGVSNAEA